MRAFFEDFKQVIWDQENRRFIFIFHLDPNESGGSFNMVFHELLINVAVFNICSKTILVLVLKIHPLQRNTMYRRRNGFSNLRHSLEKKKKFGLLSLSRFSVRFPFLCTWLDPSDIIIKQLQSKSLLSVLLFISVIKCFGIVTTFFFRIKIILLLALISYGIEN